MAVATRIGSLLGRSQELKNLTAAAGRLHKLQKTFMDAAPAELASACRVKNYRAGTLIVAAGNSAVAAKLRQLAPRMLATIRKHEPEATGIRIEVQVSAPPKAAKATAQPTRLPIDSIDEFRRLASSLDDSPLKSALTNLIRHHST